MLKPYLEKIKTRNHYAESFVVRRCVFYPLAFRRMVFLASYHLALNSILLISPHKNACKDRSMHHLQHAGVSCSVQPLTFAINRMEKEIHMVAKTDVRTKLSLPQASLASASLSNASLAVLASLRPFRTLKAKSISLMSSAIAALNLQASSCSKPLSLLPRPGRSPQSV